MSATIITKTNLSERRSLIMSFPCFASLTLTQAEELAKLMSEVTFIAGQTIVTENDLVDSIYIIVKGDAEVTRATQQRKRIVQVPVAVLGAGEGIGLSETGFYSNTGKRNATVTAIDELLLLKLEVKDLYGFLKKYDLELSMYAASQQMLRMRFIKQSLPFSKISHEKLQWLANQVEELSVKAGELIFEQGELGNKCYLIRSGKVAIITKDETATEHLLAELKPPALFGEATLITHTPRNATAKAVVDSELLVLRHEHLHEIISSESNVAKMFMTLMVDRSRPAQNENITMHYRVTADGQEITILKNPINNTYFKLSNEGKFIWDRLDGKHTLQEITLELAEKINLFAPDEVASVISRLTKSKFIKNVEVETGQQVNAQPVWLRALLKVRSMVEFRFAFGDADPLLTRIYTRYIRYFFTKAGQLFLVLLAASGIAGFVYYTPNILLFFSFKNVSLLLILGLIPLSMVEVLLHELGHAFTVKAFGREVHYIGVGWYWVSPMAFTDTSDMWLSTRRPRMLVNLAGIYVDVLSAGIASLFILIVTNPYVQAMLWLFALKTYLSGFKMLTPLQDMDGYYILMDWVEKPKLRQAAVIWLVKFFPKCLRQPSLFRQYKAEVTYWLACIIYLILVSILTLTVLTFIFAIIGINSNPYISLTIPLLVVVFSSFNIIADIRNAEN